MCIYFTPNLFNCKRNSVYPNLLTHLNWYGVQMEMNSFRNVTISYTVRLYWLYLFLCVHLSRLSDFSGIRSVNWLFFWVINQKILIIYFLITLDVLLPRCFICVGLGVLETYIMTEQFFWNVYSNSILQTLSL